MPYVFIVACDYDSWTTRLALGDSARFDIVVNVVKPFAEFRVKTKTPPDLGNTPPLQIFLLVFVAKRLPVGLPDINHPRLASLPPKKSPGGTFGYATQGGSTSPGRKG